MKILFLPQNIASMPALTAEILNRKKDISAKCLTIDDHKYLHGTKNLIVLPASVSKRNPVKWLYNKLTFARTVQKWIRWADVVHYTWTPIYPSGRDVSFANKLGKKIFVEWVGSDIRNPEHLMSINKYYKQAFKNGYEYADFESKEQSVKNQSLFAKNNATPLLCAEMKLHIDPKYFKEVQLIYQRINVKDFTPHYPALDNKRPLIIHSPTAKVGKGSNIIIPIIEDLQKHYEFDFLLLHDMSRTEVLETMEKADVFLDQIICGCYGMASMEAMSYGKPVMCYIMPEVFAAGLSQECPVINTNPDNLKEQLIRIITDATLRNDIGKKSRAYAEKFHDAESITDQLLSIYKGIKKTKNA